MGIDPWGLLRPGSSPAAVAVVEALAVDALPETVVEQEAELRALLANGLDPDPEAVLVDVRSMLKAAGVVVRASDAAFILDVDRLLRSQATLEQKAEAFGLTASQTGSAREHSARIWCGGGVSLRRADNMAIRWQLQKGRDL